MRIPRRLFQSRSNYQLQEALALVNENPTQPVSVHMPETGHRGVLVSEKLFDALTDKAERYLRLTAGS